MGETMIPEEARARVLDYINRNFEDPDETLLILDSETIHKPYGWVFFYNTKTFIETNDFIYALGGNGPIILLSEDNSLHMLGSGRPPKVEIRAFEEEKGLGASELRTAHD